MPPSRRRKASNKPVLLYWGAQWCPPCKQLKSAVFSRPDFIEKSKLFVAVYLDGDLPDAQKWGDVFRVTGYPTVVVLKPDRTEITRIAGNMDLSLYARRARRRARRRAAREGRARRSRSRATRRWPPPIAGGSPITPSISRTRVYSKPRNCRAAFENARAAVPRGAHQGTRALQYPGGGAKPPSRQKDAIEKGGKADKALTVLIVRVNETAGEQGARHGQRRRGARTAEGVLSRGAPDLAADRAGIARARDERRRRHHREPAVRAGRPARRAAHEDPRRQGVRARRQGAHRRAQRRAADRRRRCWP